MSDVSKIGVKSRQVLADILPCPEHSSFLRIHQSTQSAQQAGLARSVRPGHLQALSAGERKVNATQDVAVTPPQVQVLALKAAIGHDPPVMAGESRKFSGLAPQCRRSP